MDLQENQYMNRYNKAGNFGTAQQNFRSSSNFDLSGKLNQVQLTPQNMGAPMSSAEIQAQYQASLPQHLMNQTLPHQMLPMMQRGGVP